MLNKQDLIARIIEELSKELAVLERSAQSAAEAATHEESKAEDQYDTRGLEASYLAGAQAARAGELRRLVLSYRHLKPKAFTGTEPIEGGALVELDAEGKRLNCFLVGQGGGITVDVAGVRVQVLTPQAPLGEALVGRREGDVIEVQAKGGLREYEILSVR